MGLHQDFHLFHIMDTMDYLIWIVYNLYHPYALEKSGYKQSFHHVAFY